MRETSFVAAFLYLMLFIVLGLTALEEHRDAADPWGLGEWEIVETAKAIPILPAPRHLPVTVTIYHPVVGQTDSTPNIVASGKKIKIPRARYYRYVAVSRDLHCRWGGPLEFGDIIELRNAGYLSGYYFVEDTMNARFKNHVDVLQSPGDPLAKFPNATMVIHHHEVHQPLFDLYASTSE